MTETRLNNKRKSYYVNNTTEERLNNKRKSDCDNNMSDGR